MLVKDDTWSYVSKEKKKPTVVTGDNTSIEAIKKCEILRN